MKAMFELARVVFLLAISISDCICLAHIVEIRMNSLSVLFPETEIHLPIFRGSCSNLELMRILLIVWIAVMVYWQYFIRIILLQKANFSPHHKGSC